MLIGMHTRLIEMIFLWEGLVIGDEATFICIMLGHKCYINKSLEVAL